MKNITARPFCILADHMKVYQFLVDIYDNNWHNGVPAPFVEYAFSSFSYWMDLSYCYLDRIWEKDGEIAAFCFYENPITDTYFCLRPGYEFLASEMIAYADKHMPHIDGKFQLILFQGQNALMEAARAAGYQQVSHTLSYSYAFDKPLDYHLPDGFYFVNSEDLNIEKISECCWKGFDHEVTEGPWNKQAIRHNYFIHSAPHATPQYPVAIADKKGDYACFAGMWWVPDNQLAYMEPLCTIPNYRRKGLAGAALSELARRLKPLGAKHMTGGFHEFYPKIGFQPSTIYTCWQKPYDL